MLNVLENRKSLIAKCYLVILAGTALLLRTLVYRLTDDFKELELLLFCKDTPWTLTPMLICSLISAYFIDKGYGKMVGIISLFLILTSAIIGSGSMMWMATEYRLSGIEWVQLYGYKIRLPLAVFLFADSFMRGGAAGLLLSILSHTRMSKEGNKEIPYLSFSAIIACIFAFLLLLIDPQLSWPVIALGGALFILSAIPAFFSYKSLDYSSVEASEPGNETVKGKLNGMLPIVIFALSMIILYSYWKYMPYTWRFGLGYFALFLFSSLLSFAVGIIVLAKRPCKNSVLTGAIVLLFSMPLCALLFDYLIFVLVLAILMGIGFAMVAVPTIERVIQIPVKMYAMIWVGIAAAIKVTCNLMFRVFQRIELAFNTTTIALYIIYPLLIVILIVLGYYISSQKTKVVSNE